MARQDQCRRRRKRERREGKKEGYDRGREAKEMGEGDQTVTLKINFVWAPQ